MDLKRTVAETLLGIRAVRFSVDFPLTFKSGIVSPIYVDCRKLIYHPQAWHTVINSLKATTETLSLNSDVIAGIAVGGVPHSSALAYSLQIPSVFIRKENKGHGQARRIEGGIVKNREVLLLED